MFRNTFPSVPGTGGWPCLLPLVASVVVWLCCWTVVWLEFALMLVSPTVAKVRPTPVGVHCNHPLFVASHYMPPQATLGIGPVD